MKRHICALTLVTILIITGLYHLGIVPFKYKGKTEGQFEAIIYSNKTEKEYVNTYKAKINKKTYILYIKKSKNAKAEDLEIGDRIKIKATFQMPSTQRNYGGFDYNLYLKSKNIDGIFQVESFEKTNTKLRLPEKINVEVERFFEDLREKIENIFEKNLSKENASLLEGLTIGVKDDIDESVIENFRKASLSHILAISGAHFSYIILFITVSSKLVKRKRLTQAISILAMLFFIKLTGQSPSVIRAGVMNIFIIMASLFKRKNDFLTTLSISLLIQIIPNPYVIFDMGLILSYSGVIGIVYLYDIVYKKIKLKIISVTISANIVILPIIMLNFNTISLSFIISNLFASILLGPIIILGYISILIRIKPIYLILNILLSILSKVAELTAKLPFSSIYVTTPSIISILIYYLLLYKNVKKTTSKQKNLERITNKEHRKSEERQLQESKDSTQKQEGTKQNELLSNQIHKEKIKLGKTTSIAIVLIIIFNINYTQFSSSLFINFIDVSQGDACLVRQNNKTIMVDGGGSNDAKSSYNTGKSVVLPYLLDRKIKHIDYMIFSHFDNDHCQGLIYLLEKIRVKNIIIGHQYEEYDNYKKMKEVIKNKKVNIIEVDQGNTLKLAKNITIKIIWPNREKMIRDNSINNNSLVFKLQYKKFSMLFTGDIEAVAEKEILSEYAENKNILKSTMLKTAHHGSKTSSTEEFIKAVNPQYALIGVRTKQQI